jgi:hypothetical protein
VDAGVLAIVGERRVRGAVERTYELAVTSELIDPAELASMTPDQHRQAFLAFVAGLLGSFDEYLARGDVDLAGDGVSYRLTALWLDDAELADLRGKVDELFRPFLGLEQTAGRKRRLLATVLLPADEPRPDTRGKP